MVPIPVIKVLYMFSDPKYIMVIYNKVFSSLLRNLCQEQTLTFADVIPAE